MRVSMKRTYLWIAFLTGTILVTLDLLVFQNLFAWLLLAPLVLVTGVANVVLALWNREGWNAVLCLLTTVALCASYGVLLLVG